MEKKFWLSVSSMINIHQSDEQMFIFVQVKSFTTSKIKIKNRKSFSVSTNPLN